jgi:hypothetical protein
MSMYEFSDGLFESYRENIQLDENKLHDQAIDAIIKYGVPSKFSSNKEEEVAADVGLQVVEEMYEIEGGLHKLDSHALKVLKAVNNMMTEKAYADLIILARAIANVEFDATEVRETIKTVINSK